MNTLSFTLVSEEQVEGKCLGWLKDIYPLLAIIYEDMYLHRTLIYMNQAGAKRAYVDLGQKGLLDIGEGDVLSVILTLSSIRNNQHQEVLV